MNFLLFIFKTLLFSKCWAKLPFCLFLGFAVNIKEFLIFSTFELDPLSCNKLGELEFFLKNIFSTFSLFSFISFKLSDVFYFVLLEIAE